MKSPLINEYEIFYTFELHDMCDKWNELNRNFRFDNVIYSSNIKVLNRL